MTSDPETDKPVRRFASPACSMHEVDPAYMGLDEAGVESVAPAGGGQPGTADPPPGMSGTFTQAPGVVAEQWFNAPEDFDPESLRGRVVVLEAFQMLCPGCVSHGIPQAQRIHDTFSREDVVVLGLHTVFEHHAAMTPVSLAAFLHEYKVTFPVAVDRSHDSGMPETMRAYAMQGTPTLILVDALGRLRKQWFGAAPDMVVGAEIMRLVIEQHAGQRSG